MTRHIALHCLQQIQKLMKYTIVLICTIDWNKQTKIIIQPLQRLCLAALESDRSPTCVVLLSRNAVNRQRQETEHDSRETPGVMTYLLWYDLTKIHVRIFQLQNSSG